MLPGSAIRKKLLTQSLFMDTQREGSEGPNSSRPYWLGFIFQLKNEVKLTIQALPALITFQIGRI